MIVEDDLEIALNMKNYLETCEFKIFIFSTITDASINAKLNHFDLILLDLNLPDYGGVELLKYLNKNRINIPTIVISAYADIQKKLETFKLGAVDYMTKPVDMEEVEARIWIHLGKTSKLQEIQKDEIKDIFQIKNNQAFFRSKPIRFTKIEYEIFLILFQNKNITLKREQLSKALSSTASDRTLDYHIKNIRGKIEENIKNPQYLITEYGIGYRLDI